MMRCSPIFAGETDHIYKKRRERDSNPRYRFKPVHRFSKPTPSATRPSLQRLESISKHIEAATSAAWPRAKEHRRASIKIQYSEEVRRRIRGQEASSRRVWPPSGHLRRHRSSPYYLSNITSSLFLASVHLEAKRGSRCVLKQVLGIISESDDCLPAAKETGAYNAKVSIHKPGLEL